MTILKSLMWLIISFYPILGFGRQDHQSLTLFLFNEHNMPIENASVMRVHIGTSERIELGKTDVKGLFFLKIPDTGSYRLEIRAMGYRDYTSEILQSSALTHKLKIRMETKIQNLEEVNVAAKNTLIEAKEGKLILHVDAALSSAGSTVLELLEKSPGVILDKNGGLSMRGKSTVLVMIDGKPTYLSGNDLNALLSSMTTEQVSEIELITNPSAKYDANGNAGIINIKTKKNNQSGFNGFLNSVSGWSRASKTSNSLVLNYKDGRTSAFANIIFSRANTFTDIYANRKYSNQAFPVLSDLEQNSAITYLTNYQQIKTGLDFNASEKTTIGLSAGVARIKRNGNNRALATWQTTSGTIDSIISTSSNSLYRLENISGNLNLRHKIAKNQDLSIDLDGLRYQSSNDQMFTNQLLQVGGYTQGTIANIPSTLHILALKADYMLKPGKNSKLESGIKSSWVRTDNAANYEVFDAINRSSDPTRNNQFLYRENINAAYTSFEQKQSSLSFQLGLRYEQTHYRGSQTGNSLRPDSSFNRNYASFFPSGYLSYDADSSNTFSLTAGRRIDRPAFQKLNPFIFIVNKYTVQTGNPYIVPQYTWNLELSHRYKQLLTTTLLYSQTNNYFSQLFIQGAENTLIYTDGNVGKMRNLGVSVSIQYAPTKWWSFNYLAIWNYKTFEGYQNINYVSHVDQLQMSLINQFKLGKDFSGELSGYHITRARNDLQELLYPTGQIAAGLSKTILKGKGSLKFSARDLFFTQAMEGLTDFPHAQEYFKLNRDTRTFSLGFSYRFGKTLKNTQRTNGGAREEINRAGG